MDVFTKLRSTVSTKVSQLSGIILGNPVTREFEVVRHVASAGPGLLWRIYSGHKKTTKQILTVQHPLEESRESLAFATEPIFASLANVLGCHENMPSPLPADMEGYQLYEVEIKHGVLQLCEGLAFLHGDVRLLHRNICPESIIINRSGSWKLAGFEFCLASTTSSDQPPQWPFHEWEADIHPHAQPPLAYLAPEYALTFSCDAASDLYSLGAVLYFVFNRGRTLLGNNVNTFSAYKKHVNELKHLSVSQLGSIPNEVRDHVKLLLNVTPELRPDAHQFSKIPFFEDIGAKTLDYLDSLFQWDNLQKSHFYKGLPQVITKLPKRINLYRIIPCLAKEFVNSEMVPFVLPSVLLIAEDATKEEFCQFILPELRPVFKLLEPIQILLIFMQKMELLLKKTPAEDIKSAVLPMVYRALESDTYQIQELCLNIIPNFANMVDYPSMKNALLPRIKRLCLGTQYLSVRVNCLVCLGKLLEHLDKWLVLDDVLPLLPELPSREPAVIMGILGIYKLAMTNKKLGLTKDLMASKVIPFLMPLSTESGLNLSQFNAVIAVIKEMVNRVESEQRVKLEQLNSMKEEQRTSIEMGNLHMPNKSELISGIASTPLSETDKMFQGLGLGQYVEEKDVKKTADEIIPVSKEFKSSGNQSASNNKVSLTLEEKERLAQEQERHIQLKKQTSLQPKTQPVSVKKSVPKDLTDQLISSNLANMNLGQSNPAKSTAPNYNINLNSGPMTASPMMSATNMMQPLPFQQQIRPHPTNMTGFISNGTSSDLSNQWNFSSAPTHGPGAFNFPQPPLTQPPMRPNYNSLNNLPALSAGPSRFPMSTSPGQFITQAPCPSKESNEIPSAVSELSDLLG
ncbi:hypothetical protein CHUAL_011531 [Chamberlinius hualienensis]